MTDENANSGEGNGGQASQPTPDYGKLQEAISQLPQAVQEAVMSGVNKAVEQNRGQEGHHQEQEQHQEVKELSEQELESMSRSDLLKYIEHRFGSLVNQHLQPLQERVEQTSTTTERDRIQRQVNEAANKHPDFWEWRDEMQGLVQQYPDLTPEDLYTLAKTRNPEKAQQLQQKKQEAERSKQAEEQSKRPAFGGLTPTSGVRTSSSDRMSQKDAIESAWNDIMSEIPSEFIGGN